MNNETYIDFCFVRNKLGNFKDEINLLLNELFSGIRLNWYLEERIENGIEIVIAEVKGMSRWDSEDATIQFIEDRADEKFWDYLQGFKMYIYPAKRGCNSCGSH